MTILKAIFGDWSKVFAPDNHSDEYKLLPTGYLAG